MLLSYELKTFGTVGFYNELSFNNLYIIGIYIQMIFGRAQGGQTTLLYEIVIQLLTF